MEPLYAELHKYVGRKLKERFGSKLEISDGLIPANVLGNMWAQEWNNIAELVRPFPQASKVDVDAALKQQKYSVLDMFKIYDEFYKSMGLIPMGVCYNTSAGAMIEKLTDGREYCVTLSLGTSATVTIIESKCVRTSISRTLFSSTMRQDTSSPSCSTSSSW